MEAKTVGLVGSVMLILVAVTVVVGMLRRHRDYGVDPAIIEMVRDRVVAWWLLFGSLLGAFLIETSAAVVLFGLISFWALREYITLTPTRLADHSTLAWIFFLWTPLQFTLVGLDRVWFVANFGLEPYTLFSILIPIYGFLMLPACMAMSGDSKYFLDRIAKIQVGLLICVYSLSFAPAILTMPLPHPTLADASEPVVTSPLLGHVIETTVDAAMMQVELEPNPAPNPTPSLAVTEQGVRTMGPHIRLLFFFVLLTQVSDMLQYLASQVFRYGIIAPTINSTRSWFGVGMGVVSTGLFGLMLWFFTPYTHWWQAGVVAMAVSAMGFAGSMTTSAIKRDRGVDDYGKLIDGHSGVLDRIDSLCFAAPVFYHLTWLFLWYS